MIKRIKEYFLKLKKTPEDEEDLREIISDSLNKKIINADEEKLIDSIFELEDTYIEEIMIPRIDMEICENNLTLNELIDIINKTGRSRIPIYHEKIDNIVGIVYGKDILKFIKKDLNIRAVEIARPPYFIPETKTVLSTLREFQKNKISIAIVIDEYGGVSGLITMEDIIEEIVGELQDELDKEELTIVKLSENTYMVNAKTDLDNFNQYFNTNFEYENVNTVGGLILTELEHIPKKHETINISNMEFKIDEISKNRIKRIIVKDLRSSK